MTPSTDKYVPIACNFYDRIEETIVLRKSIELRFEDESGVEQSLQTRLKDTKTAADGEYVVLPEGQMIRMDRIISLDGVKLWGSC